MQNSISFYEGETLRVTADGSVDSRFAPIIAIRSGENTTRIVASFAQLRAIRDGIDAALATVEQATA